MSKKIKFCFLLLSLQIWLSTILETDLMSFSGPGPHLPQSWSGDSLLLDIGETDLDGSLLMVSSMSHNLHQQQQLGNTTHETTSICPQFTRQKYWKRTTELKHLIRRWSFWSFVLFLMKSFTKSHNPSWVGQCCSSRLTATNDLVIFSALLQINWKYQNVIDIILKHETIFWRREKLKQTNKCELCSVALCLQIPWTLLKTEDDDTKTTNQFRTVQI